MCSIFEQAANGLACGCAQYDKNAAYKSVGSPRRSSRILHSLHIPTQRLAPDTHQFALQTYSKKQATKVRDRRPGLKTKCKKTTSETFCNSRKIAYQKSNICECWCQLTGIASNHPGPACPEELELSQESTGIVQHRYNYFYVPEAQFMVVQKSTLIS